MALIPETISARETLEARDEARELSRELALLLAAVSPRLCVRSRMGSHAHPCWRAAATWVRARAMKDTLLLTLSVLREQSVLYSASERPARSETSRR